MHSYLRVRTCVDRQWAKCKFQEASTFVAAPLLQYGQSRRQKVGEFFGLLYECISVSGL
jgi:hypothetical protein